MATRLGAAGTRASGRVYLVQDKKEFAAALTEAINERFGGNRKTAAKAAGIPNSTLLARFVRQQGDAVREETLGRLRKLVGPERVTRLEGALLTPIARTLLTRYDAWCAAAIRAAFVEPVVRAPYGDVRFLDYDI